MYFDSDEKLMIVNNKKAIPTFEIISKSVTDLGFGKRIKRTFLQIRLFHNLANRHFFDSQFSIPQPFEMGIQAEPQRLN